MTAFLNILFSIVGVLFFSGRLYEVVFLMEEGTNFLSKGIVTTPLMIGIIFVISVCCGVIAFADKKDEAKPLKISVGVFGVIPAPFIVGASVLNIMGIFKTGGFLGYDILMILSAIGLAMLGTMNIKGKKKEKLPVALTMAMPLAMCMNAVILKVEPVTNTLFMYYGLSAITVLVFFLLLFKNAYAPSAGSRAVLYVASLMNFLIAGCASLANLIGGFFTGVLSVSDILLYIALTVIGVYSLSVAFFIMPTDEETVGAPAPKPKKAKKAKKYEYDEEDEDYSYSYTEDDEEDEYVSEFLPTAKQLSAAVKATEENSAQEVEKISQAAIAKLFAQKDGEEYIPAETVEEPTTQIPLFRKAETYSSDEIPVEKTQPVYIPEFHGEKTAEKHGKTVFRSSGKKETSGKVVYKAPKK